MEWKQEQQGIVGMPDEPNIGDVRDPFLFTFNGSHTPSRAPATRTAPP